MTSDVNIKTEISTEKLQKYQHYYQAKLVNINILQVKNTPL